MQPLFLCWMFDKRWLWGIPNPCMEFLLLIPLCLNSITIAAIIVERSSAVVQVQPKIIALISIYGLLSLVCLFLLIRTHVVSQNEMVEVAQNSEVICQFTHQFEIKKGIWSWVGLLVTILSISQIILNNLYIKENKNNYSCLANTIRFWVDIGGWGYIGFVILTFLLCKLCFLFVSWKHPQKYLEYKQVI